jgi:predicted HicB family RNase H-like nuclease
MNFENSSNGSQTPTQWMSSNSEETVTKKPVSTRLKDKAAEEAGEKLAAEMKVFNDVATELRAKRNASLSAADRRKLVVETATELFGVAPTWTAFYRETIGADGVARALFDDMEEAHEYECSDEHSKVMEMLTVLRSRDLPENDPHEPQRMITVRIPKSLHDSICQEANKLAVSVNKLCISRMLQKVDLAMIPSSSQKRRGRRPGSAGSSKPAAETNRIDFSNASTDLATNDCTEE